MTKDELYQLFLRALDTAAESAEVKLSKPVSRSFLVELHAPKSPGSVASVEEALDNIYLESDRFYKIIDIGVKELMPTDTVVFVCISGHAAVEFSKTWDPHDPGPFKQILATT